MCSAEVYCVDPGYLDVELRVLGGRDRVVLERWVTRSSCTRCDREPLGCAAWLVGGQWCFILARGTLRVTDFGGRERETPLLGLQYLEVLGMSKVSICRG